MKKRNRFNNKESEKMELIFKTLKQKLIISASPEEIYNAIIDAEKHSEFTGSKAKSDPKIGGKFTSWDGYIFGKYIELDKGKKIVQEWKTTEWPNGYPPSIFELNLKKLDNGTEIEMVHSKVPREQADNYDQGWKDYYWKPLKTYFKNKK